MYHARIWLVGEKWSGVSGTNTQTKDISPFSCALPPPPPWLIQAKMSMRLRSLGPRDPLLGVWGCPRFSIQCRPPANFDPEKKEEEEEEEKKKKKKKKNERKMNKKKKGSRRKKKEQIKRASEKDIRHGSDIRIVTAGGPGRHQSALQARQARQESPTPRPKTL